MVNHGSRQSFAQPVYREVSKTGNYRRHKAKLPDRFKPPRFNSFRAIKGRGPKSGELIALHSLFSELLTSTLEGANPLAEAVELSSSRLMGLMLSDLFTHIGVSASPSLAHCVTESKRRRRAVANLRKVEKCLNRTIQERTNR